MMMQGSAYVDDKGYWVQVMPAVERECYRAVGRKRRGYKVYSPLPWRASRAEAQKDLDKHAQAAGWTWM